MNTNAIMDCFLNPYKAQIVQTIMEKGKCTAKDLIYESKDIPQATLYRTLNGLVDDGIIFVAEENKVRAMTQKVYSVNPELNQYNNTIITENDGTKYFKLFSGFVITLLKEFQAYSLKESINILEDGSGFSAVPIYATTKELEDMGMEINQIIKKYMKRDLEKGDEQKVHILATVITPPKEIEGEMK